MLSMMVQFLLVPLHFPPIPSAKFVVVVEVSALMGRLRIATLFGILVRRLRKTNNTNTTISNRPITVTVAAMTVVELVEVA